MSIKKDEPITWINNDSIVHNVHSDDNVSFESGDILPGTSYKYIAVDTGTFKYHCEKHGEQGVLSVYK